MVFDVSEIEDFRASQKTLFFKDLKFHELVWMVFEHNSFHLSNTQKSNISGVLKIFDFYEISGISLF